MSVNVFDRVKVQRLYAASLSLVGDGYVSADLFAAMHGAQDVAHLLTYGEVSGEPMFSNRNSLGEYGSLPEAVAGAPMTPGEIQSDLRHMAYNWCSNGGTDCLPAKYEKAFERLMRAITVQGLSDPACRDTLWVGSVQVKNDGAYGVMVIPGEHSGARKMGASGVEYVFHHHPAGDLQAFMTHVEAINTDIQAAWVARLIGDGLMGDPTAPLVIEYQISTGAAVVEMPASDAFAALVGQLVATPKAQAYLSRLVCPLKRAYAASVVAELGGGPVAVLSDGLSPECAGKIRSKLSRYMSAPVLN